MLLCFVIVYLFAPRIERNVEELDVTTLKVGDLLFFSGSSYGDRVISLFTRSPYTHVCMVVQEGPEPKVWKIDRKGPRVSQWFDTCKRYRDVIGVRHIKHVLETIDVNTVINKYTAYRFDNNMLRWLWPTRETRRHIFCSEMMVLALRKLNLEYIDRPPCSYAPGELATMNMFSYGSLCTFRCVGACVQDALHL